jgi:hypothetical protein
MKVRRRGQIQRSHAEVTARIDDLIFDIERALAFVQSQGIDNP